MILVVGTGRTGTSDVARILEELGVMMGHQFHLPDEFNPNGYFEDKEFQGLNVLFVLLGLNDKPNEEKWGLWRRQFEKLLRKRKEPWGLKDPGMADFDTLLDEYLKLEPHVIWCKRDKKSAVQSYVKMKKVPQEEAERIYDKRYKLLESKIKDYLRNRS